MTTLKQAVSELMHGLKYFTTMDAANGYWQVPLDEESQDLTCFMTPIGPKKYLRLPMGLSQSQDDYNRESWEIIKNVDNSCKVLDDVATGNKTFKGMLEQVIQILDNCREKGITLNRDKFEFGKQELKYAGYILSKDGIRADPAKLEAIAKFPAPTTRKELRSFLGLVEQLASFSKDLSGLLEPIRPLLREKNMFVWEAAQQEAFDKVKQLMTSLPVLASYEPGRPLTLQTDASRLKGLGYVLLQEDLEGRQRLLEAGSRFISETESRYAMVELELLAVTWALKKCKVFLSGQEHFRVITDHRPLIPILNSQNLSDVENPRIQRLKEATLGYNFTTEWKKGSEHVIADALSRAPVSDPTEEDTAYEEKLQYGVTMVRQIASAKLGEVPEHLRDPQIEELKKLAIKDEDYKLLVKAVKEGFPKTLTPELKPFKKLEDSLRVEKDLALFQDRIVIPAEARKDVLKKLHLAHQGMDRTKRRARATVFWPGMNNDIESTVEACFACQEARPSLAKEPMIIEDPPKRPGQDGSADLFTTAGKQFMVYCDRFSGWPEVTQWNNMPSSKQVVRSLQSTFSTIGIPVRIRSDGGPQFKAQEFLDFLTRWGIVWEPSSVENPSSNGHAEAAVKAMKTLLNKTGGDVHSEEFKLGLLEWRNTPNKTGKSPAQIMFGRPQRTLIPIHEAKFSEKVDLENVRESKSSLSKKSKMYYDSNTKSHPELEVGDKVMVQDKVSGKWSGRGIILKARKQNRSYEIEMANGRITSRNRRFIRKETWSNETPVKKKVTFADDLKELRRSHRKANKPDFYKS